MAFDKEKLHKTVEMRRKTMTGQEMLQEAALAYARWQGLTQEEGIGDGGEVSKLGHFIHEEGDWWVAVRHGLILQDAHVHEEQQAQNGSVGLEFVIGDAQIDGGSGH